MTLYTREELSAMSGEEFAAARSNGFAKPDPAVETSQPPPADDNVWAGRKASAGREFVAPSGQRCLLRPLSVEALLAAGVLDQVTRLEGLAQQLVDRSEGKPPAPESIPGREEIGDLLKLINTVVPMAVAKPPVQPIPENGERSGDLIYVDDIELMDRVAILNASLVELKELDNFR